MTSDKPEVWLFYPRGYPSRIRDAVAARCEEIGWHYESRHSTRFESGIGRKFQIVSPDVATELYESIHRRRVGVWEVLGTSAPIIPNPKPNPRHYRRLSMFVRYKAFHAQLDPEKFDADWMQQEKAFKMWMKAINCEGESDPRCLPFHVFANSVEEYDLNGDGGRKKFSNHHGSQGSRRDDESRIWERAKALHGSDVVTIAGRDLVKGFHWDVSAGNVFKVATTSEIWQVRKNGYINVYPDARIRGTQSSKQLF